MKKQHKLACLLLALAMCLSLAACGGGSKGDIPEDSGIWESDFYGTWMYDEYGTFVVINSDGTWDMYGTDGSYAGSSTYIFDESSGSVVLFDGSGEPDVVLSYIDGGLIDSDGDTLSYSELPGSGEERTLPAPEDPLTESIEFPNDPGVWVSYPALMEGHPQDGAQHILSFNAINEDGTDDYYSNIIVALVPATVNDDDLCHGKDLAKVRMQELLDGSVQSMYGDKVLKMFGSDFADGGSYWSLKSYAWVDGSIFVNPTTQPVRAAFEIRYAGPTGYVLLTCALSVESRIANYFGIACKMMDSVTFGGNWSTAPKSVPAIPPFQLQKVSPAGGLLLSKSGVLFH